MIPYLSIVFSAGALFQKIREMDKNIKKIKMGAKDTETSLYTIDMRVIKLETVLDNIEVSLNVPSIQPNKNGGTTMPRKIKQICNDQTDVQQHKEHKNKVVMSHRAAMSACS